MRRESVAAARNPAFVVQGPGDAVVALAGRDQFADADDHLRLVFAAATRGERQPHPAFRDVSAAPHDADLNVSRRAPPPGADRRDQQVGTMPPVKDLLADAEKSLEHEEPPGYRRVSPPRRPTIWPVLPVIRQILDEDATAPWKQRHTSYRIWQRL